MTTAESPLAWLSEQELEKLAKELDAIHDEVFAELAEAMDQQTDIIKSAIEAERSGNLPLDIELAERKRLMDSVIRGITCRLVRVVTGKPESPLG